MSKRASAGDADDAGDAKKPSPPPSILAKLERNIVELKLQKSRLKELPAQILEFASLKKLDLAFNPLKTLPQLPPSIEIMFFLGCEFEYIPDAVGQCPKLTMLSFKNCLLKEVKEDILPLSVNWLILSGNQLTTLPSDVGRLTRLRKVMLSNNLLSSLPKSMQKCTGIELLRLANNKLKEVPSWLLDLPKLAFLATSGNPCSIDVPAGEIKRGVCFEDITLKETVGEGTSGLVYRGEYEGQEVAVKVYKELLSSDGRAIDEVSIAAYLHHPNMLRVLGCFEKPQLGTVQVLASGLHDLGKPPDLQTISRDTYLEGTEFSTSFVLKAARGICQAAKYMHSMGVMHGDLYAHNILVDDDGNATLGDFGASVFYGKGGDIRYEKMEVRAFGFLLEELVTHHKGGADSDPCRTLKSHCFEVCNARRSEQPTVVR